MIHELKIWPKYFVPVVNKIKTFEIRKNDRGGFSVGDTLFLNEFCPDKKEYTGRSVYVDVIYVLEFPEIDFVVMSIKIKENEHG